MKVGTMLRAVAALSVLLAAAPALADDTDVPAGVGPTSKEAREKKKKTPPAWQSPDATVGKAFFGVMVAAGSGWISGKAYKDDPVTDATGDGPSVGKGMHDAGTAARWSLSYVFPKGVLLGGYARMGIAKGSLEGIDDAYDAWLMGIRVGYLIYSRYSIDIFVLGGLGYGHMRHRVSSVPSPLAEPDAFTRRDLWPFTPRPRVDVLKKSGFIDVDMGFIILYHFTPIFGLVFEVNGDLLAPDLAFNIDVSGGLAVSFP
jgi:hypothetical protein